VSATDQRPTLGLVPGERILLSKKEAAEALGMSLDHFEEHVRPHLRPFISNTLLRFPVSELVRYVEKTAKASKLGAGVSR
jgi:hypothetical protein